MDPLGRCFVIYLVFLLLTTLFSLSASAMHTLRAPDDTDDNSTANRLLSKKNAYRLRLATASGVSVFVCGIASAYMNTIILGNRLSEPYGWVSLIVLCVVFSILPCSVGIYIPKAISEKISGSPVLYAVADFALVLALILSFIPLGISKTVLKVFSIEPDSARSDVTEQEILQLMDEGETSGVLNSEEREMIENIFDFSEQTVREIMKHYMDVAAIREDLTDDEILEIISENGYSRYPVYSEDITKVVGVLLAKEYLCNSLSKEPKPFSELIRDPLFVPDTMAVDLVRRSMNDSGQHMAIVVNEYGEACGIVTMEDLLEEIMGKIYDETDTAEERESEIKKISENEYLVRATCTIDEFEDESETEFDTPEGIDTVGALVFSKLTTIPDDGIAIDVTVNRLMLHSEGLSERRLDWVKITVLPEKSEEE